MSCVHPPAPLRRNIWMTGPPSPGGWPWNSNEIPLELRNIIGNSNKNYNLNFSVAFTPDLGDIQIILGAPNWAAAPVHNPCCGWERYKRRAEETESLNLSVALEWAQKCTWMFLCWNLESIGFPLPPPHNFVVINTRAQKVAPARSISARNTTKGKQRHYSWGRWITGHCVLTLPTARTISGKLIRERARLWNQAKRVRGNLFLSDGWWGRRRGPGNFFWHPD